VINQHIESGLYRKKCTPKRRRHNQDCFSAYWSRPKSKHSWGYFSN